MVAEYSLKTQNGTLYQLGLWTKVVHYVVNKVPRSPTGGVCLRFKKTLGLSQTTAESLGDLVKNSAIYVRESGAIKTQPIYLVLVRIGKNSRP